MMTSRSATTTRPMRGPEEPGGLPDLAADDRGFGLGQIDVGEDEALGRVTGGPDLGAQTRAADPVGPGRALPRGRVSSRSGTRSSVGPSLVSRAGTPLPVGDYPTQGWAAMIAAPG